MFKNGFGPFGPKDLVSIGKGFLIAIAGAVLTYIAFVIQQYSNSPTAIHYAIYFTILSLIVNACRKALDGVKE